MVPQNIQFYYILCFLLFQLKYKVKVMEKKFTDYMQDIIDEVYMRKRTSLERRAVKKRAKVAHRGTNWHNLKPKRGYKRVKMTSKRYIRVPLSAIEKMKKRQIGRSLGKNPLF